MKNILLIVTAFILIACPLAQAHSAFYTAKNINVLIKSSDLTTARDQALLQAQKIAVDNFASMTDAQQVEKLKNINQMSLSRTMKDFSLQNEKIGSGTYQAAFTIRFDKTKLEGLLAGYSVALPPVMDIDLSNLQYKDETAAAAPDGTTQTADGATATPATAAAPQKKVIVLPVLDIGSRRVIWDEPNPWRDSWQKQTSLKTTAQIIVPLGDVTDITDIPDGTFLTTTTAAGNANIQHMLERYSAEKLYVLVAKSQGAALNPTTGLEITIYSHDGTTLKNVGKINSSARPGYLFDDAVAFTAPKIDEITAGTFGKTIPAVVAAAANNTNTVTPSPPQAPVFVTPRASANSVSATIPVPNLTAWVKIQQKLRRVAGVRNIMTQTINPQNVSIRIDSSEPADILLRNIQAAGFRVTDRGNGQYILTDLTNGA